MCGESAAERPSCTRGAAGHGAQVWEDVWMYVHTKHASMEERIGSAHVHEE